MLQFLVVITVILNRETALRTATEGKSGGHHPVLIAVHVILAVLIFIMATAAQGLNFDTGVKLVHVRTRPDFNKAQQRFDVAMQLFYAYSSFAILTGIDVAVSTVLLWRAWKKAGIRDPITNMLLYAVLPAYSLLSLFTMIFTIVFSPSGLPATTNAEGADLAATLLVTLFSATVIAIILVMSAKKAAWNVGGVGSAGYWAPQTQYNYGAPVQGAQPGYYPPEGAQPMQYPPQEVGAGSYYPETHQPMQYAPQQYPPQEVGVGSYHPETHAHPGPYTPPYTPPQ
jgi:hypothetical protein